jgi:hypothetical protein
MKRFIGPVIGAILAIGLSAGAWAQQRDLEVTIDVLPPDATPTGAVNEIKLPDAASPAAKEAAAFGLSTANRARELKNELGQEFGEQVSEAARGIGKGGPPSFVVPKPPAK